MWKSFALSVFIIVSLVAMASEPCGAPPHFGYDNSTSNGPFYRPINAAALLPVNRSYFSYEGSLTTPACDQTVTWFVFKAPIFATAQQIRRLQEVFGDNARPIQDPRGRVVSAR